LLLEGVWRGSPSRDVCISELLAGGRSCYLQFLVPAACYSFCWGLLSSARGQQSLLFADVSSPFIYFCGLAAVAGLGFGLTITTTTVTTQTVVSPENVGVATSFNTLLRTIGQSMMVSVYGIILNTALIKGAAENKKITVDMMNQLIDPQTASSLPTELLPKMRQILFSGLHNMYVASLVLLIIGLILNAFELKNRKILGSE